MQKPLQRCHDCITVSIGMALCAFHDGLAVALHPGWLACECSCSRASSFPLHKEKHALALKIYNPTLGGEEIVGLGLRLPWADEAAWTPTMPASPWQLHFTWAA